MGAEQERLKAMIASSTANKRHRNCDATGAIEGSGGGEGKFWPDAKSGLEGLRFHDLRGTAATNFMRCRVDDVQIATVLGWKVDQVGD